MATGKINALSIKEYTTISDIVTASSGFTISSAKVIIWGKVAQLVLNISKASAVTTDSNLTIANVKSAFRPSATTNGIANTSTIKVSSLGSNGNVDTYGTWTAGTTRTLSFFYILP